MLPTIKICSDAVCLDPAVSIRPAVITDARPLAGLMTELGYPTEKDEMQARLRLILPRSDYLVGVAVEEERVVGAAASVGPNLAMDGLHGRVTALIVAADRRGLGIGARLLEHAESWLRARGAAACIINCSQHRVGAHRFYHREGYQATGIRFRKDLGS
jgi:GNAT superfamily N-acetyltransferase